MNTGNVRVVENESTGKTFDATKLEEIIDKMRSEINPMIIGFLKGISSNASELSSICRSEDSSLASAYNDISSTTLKLADKMEALLPDLASELEIYMQETVTNETLTSKELADINETIYRANQKIDEISWK